MLVRQSELDQSVTVIEVEMGDTGQLVDLLETRGHGFTVLGIEQRMVVVDGRLRSQGKTGHHLLAIEAHEIGHLQVGDDEREADLAGIRLLQNARKPMAARLLRARL
jgi:Zn-dependent protease with chaperone function